MITFHAPQLADKPWVDELLARADYRGCDYNFTNLFAWEPGLQPGDRPRG